MKKILTVIQKWSWSRKIAVGLFLVGMLLLIRHIFKNLTYTPKPTPEYPFAPILYPKQQIRNDTLGYGHYGASRTGHDHHGIDILTTYGQVVYAPFDGTVTREFQVYKTDQKYRGVEIVSDSNNFKMKIMYCNPKSDRIGYHVRQGDIIAFSQDISEKYGKLMKPHLHVELYQNNVRIDPQTHIQLL